MNDVYNTELGAMPAVARLSKILLAAAASPTEANVCSSEPNVFSVGFNPRCTISQNIWSAASTSLELPSRLSMVL